GRGGGGAGAGVARNVRHCRVPRASSAISAMSSQQSVYRPALDATGTIGDAVSQNDRPPSLVAASANAGRRPAADDAARELHRESGEVINAELGRRPERLRSDLPDAARQRTEHVRRALREPVVLGAPTGALRPRSAVAARGPVPGV